MKPRIMLTALAAASLLALTAPAGAGTLDLQQDRPIQVAPAWAAPDVMSDLVSEHPGSGVMAFRPGSDELTAESRERLDLMSHLLPQDDATVLTIRSTSVDALAARRAAAVQDYLASRGVTETRLDLQQPADRITAAADGAADVQIEVSRTAG